MSDTAAVAAPETPAAPPPEDAKREAAADDDDESSLPQGKDVPSLIARLKARQAREASKAAKAEAAAKPADGDAEKPAKDAPEKGKSKADAKPDEGPERGPDGKFLPKGGKPAEEEDTKREKQPAKPKETPEKDAPLPDAAKADDAVADRIDAKAEKLEDAGAKVPEQKAGESDRQYELKLSRQLLENKRLQTELLKSQGEAKRAKELDDLLARVKGDTLDEDAYEKLTGRTLVETIKNIAKGKDAGGVAYKAKNALPPEMQAAIAKIDAWEAKQREATEAQERAANEARAREVRTSESSACKTWLESQADALPYLSSMEDAGEQLLDAFYNDWLDASGGKQFNPTKKPDLEDVAKRFEAATRKRLAPVLSSERVRRHLGLAESPREAAPPAAVPAEKQDAEPPRTLSSRVTQEVPVRVDRQLTEEEESARRAEEFARYRQRMGWGKR